MVVSFENSKCSFHNIGDNECLKILIAHTYESYFPRWWRAGIWFKWEPVYSLFKRRHIPMSRVFHHGLAVKCSQGVKMVDEQL